MREFGELELENYIFYKHAKFDFGYKGISYIQALNKDAASTSETSTNAAGKSLLFGSVPEIFFDVSPSGKEVKASSRTGSASQTLTVGKDTYVVKKSWKGTKRSLEIFKNGKPTQTRTLAYAEQQASKLIGLTEEEFYSLAYVDTKKPHPLIVGTTAMRQDYFTKMFRLQDSDNMRKLLLGELRECEQAAASYKELSESYKEIKGKTSVSYVKELEAEVSELTARNKELIAYTNKASDLKQLFDFREQNSKLIERVNVLLGGEFDKHGGLLKTLSSSVKELNKAHRDALRYEQAKEDAKLINSQWDNALKKLRVFGITEKHVKKAAKGDRLYVAAKSQVDTLTARLVKLQAAYDAGREEVKDSLKRVSDIKINKPIAKLQEEVERWSVKIKQLEHELNHAEKFGKGKCPTCGQDVKARNPKEIRESILSYTKERAEVREAIAVKTKQSALDVSMKEIAEVSADLKTASVLVNKYAKYHSAYKSTSKLPARIETALTKPKNTSKELEKERASLQKKLSVLEAAEPVIELIKKAAALTEKDEKTFSSLSKKIKELSEVNARLAIAETKLAEEKVKLQSLRTMKSRAMKLKDKALDAPILKAMTQVYSNKGLKKLMIQRYAAVIQDQVNKFKSILFAEDITFQFVFDTQFSILAHRRHGKHTATSDVRKLSGAETKAFALLLVLATLSLVPKSRRLNFLVLDEADANMGPSMMSSFARFIPILNKVIPHIIVVTPKPVVPDYENARYFTVVKSGGKSRLVPQRLSNVH